MRKVTRKEFVVCKDVNGDKLSKGDLVFIHPVEFFDTKDDCSYRDHIVEGLSLDPAMVVDVMILTKEEYSNMLHDREWEIKYYAPIDLRMLPELFNEFKIQPRNITMEFDD